MGERVILHLAGLDGVTTGSQVIDTRDLGDARSEALQRLEAVFQALTAAGCVVVIGGQARLYQIDDISRLNIAGAAVDALAVLQGVAGATWPAGFYWIAADNTEQPMTAAECFVWAQAIKSYWASLIYANRALKNQVLALTTLADCDSFDATQGWPSNP